MPTKFKAPLRRRRSTSMLLATTEGHKHKDNTLVDRRALLCPICFDLLSFPVTLPCGHNYDRGCLLTAWDHEETVNVDSDDPSDDAEAKPATHSCPLCRQTVGMEAFDDLQVNLLLKQLIATQYPIEIEAVASREKSCVLSSAEMTDATASTVVTAHQPPSERLRHAWRTASSFFYVWLASVTEPPGFLLACLLLLSLLAIMLTPQQMLSSTTALPTLFASMDYFLNGFVLLIREISSRFDQLDDLWPWFQAFSFIL
ncbi:hypothetical protein Poli38472_000852 [Pythium oligandrum]|uniref:RING-type domain-containing protein n=1 Tax=Pythium oligandrum TaxID=41045 RepID=A0A8K1FEQ9_PYTOL|nr:hypothetical protein Poli38472_000852 [Pythium oligandrum]|eukprot:TMW60810.1 hypothetical protein Poli38472_000852 [Pythium oligandrum]